MNKWLFTLSILLLATAIKPQVTEEWVARYNGPGDLNDISTDLAVDSEGNTYVTGRSFGGSTSWDYATIKYDSAGVEQWVQRYNGTANGFDEATSIIIDNEDNVYVTGNIFGGGTRNDYATIKYNSDGVQEWVKIYNSPGNGDDRAKSIAVDNDGNIYVTGYSFGNVSMILRLCYNQI
ncbi:MAG: SBBP repeat-containing protein [Ignavibacteriales bacterium]|nr:SBBP repeat-containing protein [Ignavibacteriales bacterium]